MRDFLQSLVARSIDPSVGLQPRLPGLFEPMYAPRGLWVGPVPRAEADPDVGSTDELLGDAGVPKLIGADLAPTAKVSVPGSPQSESVGSARMASSDRGSEPRELPTSDNSARRPEAERRRRPSVEVKLSPAEPIRDAGVSKPIEADLAPTAEVPMPGSPQSESVGSEPLAAPDRGSEPRELPTSDSSSRRPEAEGRRRPSVKVKLVPAEPIRGAARKTEEDGSPATARAAASVPKLATTVVPAEEVLPEMVYLDRREVRGQRAVVALEPVLLPRLGIEVPRVPHPPKPERTVQVTIGRLEVRAIPAPRDVAKPEAKERSGMTLDQYLRERREGRVG